MQNPLAVDFKLKQQSKFTQNSTLNQAILSEIQEIQSGFNYPHRISFYECPPLEEISMEDFELFAVDRLRALENGTLCSKNEDDLMRILQESQKKFLPMSASIHFKQGIDVDKERRKDHISHFVLRLAYCRNDDLKSWFVRYETLLFKLRWEILSKEEKILFLQSSAVSSFSSITEAEKIDMSSNLMASSYYAINSLSQTNPGASFLQLGTAFIQKENYFKIPFEKVPDLIGRRECFVSKGFTYVPQSFLISVLIAEFKSQLQKDLDVTQKSLPKVDDDDRLKPMLNALSKQYLGQEYCLKSSAMAGKVSHTDIDSLSSLFPPCMRHLHNQLRRDKHLKHQGRMQYGLFLKGIGLSLEEALVFWRQSFSSMTDDKFQKGGYAYNIRHNYGQEGKRANYTPFGCMKIITTNAPSHGDHHGCPFRHFSTENLIRLLSEFGLKEEEKREISGLAKQHHYQLACTKYRMKRAEEDGTLMPKEINIETITHPNQFFDSAAKAAGLAQDEEEKGSR